TAACGSDRPRDRQIPASYGSACETRSSGRCGPGPAETRTALDVRAPDRAARVTPPVSRHKAPDRPAGPCADLTPGRGLRPSADALSGRSRRDFDWDRI